MPHLRQQQHQQQQKQCIGARIIQNFQFLKRLSCTRSQRKLQKLLAAANPDELLSIVEVCTNILRGAFPLKARQHKKLIPFAPVVRKLARARSEKRTRQIIGQQQQHQSGSGAGILFTSLLAPVLIEAAKQLISDGK